jgi:ferrochelatase
MNPPSPIGILLTNIGTPLSPDAAAVRRYLRAFLSDPRVVELPRLLWWPILYGFILPFRSSRSAKLYQKIWTPEGSPLLIHSQKIADALEKKLQCPVALGMHYSEPPVEHGLEKLRALGVKKILLLPLFPQYSATTTASSFDDVANIFKQWRELPSLCTISHYADNTYYVDALCETILAAQKKEGMPEYLLFSFHGIPKKYADAGDPYAKQCYLTAKCVADKLQLRRDTWSVAFQSRLGRAPWLKPYTDQVLKELPKKGVKHLQVICPGFSTDCLETLEEIALRGKEQFLQAGGKSFHYIPALNESESHVECLAELVRQNIQEW